MKKASLKRKMQDIYMLGEETSASLQDIENLSHKQSGHSNSSGKESRKISRKRRHSITDKDGTVSKKLCLNVTVNSNEDSEFPTDLQDKPEHDELDNTCQTKQYIPHHLIGLMYQLHLSVLCLLRLSMYKNKYPLLSLAFGDSEIDKFNDIVFRYDKKSIHIKIENVDKYYLNNSINYARLFTKEKRSFAINNYFDSFVKYLISKSDSLSNNIEYLIVYTNSGFDLTPENNLREGKFKNFYPFKFESVNIEELDILKDFLFINNNTQESGLYRFSRDKTTKEELSERLEFSSAMQKVIKERRFSQDFEREIKEAFIDKLVFAINQPNREELNSSIKNEMEKNCSVENDYIELQERVLHDLTAPKKDKKLENHVSRIIYEFNLLMLFLHDMFLYENIFSINYEGKSHDISNNIALDYKDNITYVKAYNSTSNIGYSQLFPSRQHMFSINNYFTLFVEELRESAEYFIIYTNANLDLTKEKKLKEGRSKDFHPLKFDNDKALRECSCSNENGLYRFVQEATRKKVLNLLKLPPSLQKEKEENRLSSENEQKIKDIFLDKLIFATNQPNRNELINIIKDEIHTFDVPYNFEELHEIALRWSESHEFGPLTKGIMEKLLGDIKYKRSSCKKIQNKNINKEIKFAKSVVGREGTPAFNQFLNFLITGNGKKCLEVLKKEEIDLSNMSSILHVAGSNATKAFTNLYDIWFTEQGIKTQYLKALEKEGINLCNMSSILGGAGSNASRAFKDLYDLWFDVEGSKTKYLKTLENERIYLARMSSILSGAGANAAKAFKDLYDLWFDDGEGNKTQYLKTLEKGGINLCNVSGILNVAGVHAAKVFRDLYDLWFDEEGNKTQYLKTLEKEGIDLARVSSILSGAGANAAKVFKDLYNIWFDEEGNKTQYLKTLEKEGIGLARMSSILSGAGVNAAKAFKDLYDIWFDAKGNMKRHLQHFIEDKYRNKSFTLHNLSGILGRAGGNSKDAFAKFHKVCFSDKGKRTNLLDDFYNEGFTPSNLSSTLCGAGIRASIIIKRLHSNCFNEKREKTKFLDDFLKAGFKPRDLCGMLSAAANSLIKFHDFCFMAETEKYLNHFLIEKEGFRPKNLSKILHGSGANICSALKDFHDVCFDEIGNKTRLLDDFYEAGFTPGDLSNVLSLAGNNAACNLRKFHKSCFNKENYLHSFLDGNKLFTPKYLSKILYGVGINICPMFKKLHDLCFDKAGNTTKYIKNLIKNNPPNRILDILYEEIRKSSTL
ncbi:uncharacterized protein LOC112045794 isoform X1 [Bicyclus anynana]|uniref:Uncharacterized protein LOC112045794 isoform X1 n=1 Tax=Bicyclus anynana TaxID=110368 RepID=A0ABM3M2H4_BICAN|nr:uncharacterized protein LOC112045794 isoform X1 [Bicyclus anynana]